jgi:hypothetical protein
MEHVSELAALKFTDTPGCTDPLLAALAQLVNDAISDDARRRLLGFARQLAIRPRGGTASAPAIVLAAPMPVLERQPQRRDLRRHQARARRRFSRVENDNRRDLRSRLRDELYRRGPARHALMAAVGAASRVQPDAARDQLLTAMLHDANEVVTPPVLSSAAALPDGLDRSADRRRQVSTDIGAVGR